MAVSLNVGEKVKAIMHAAYKLHRHLIEEVYTFVLVNEELVAEALFELKDYQEFFERQHQLNEKCAERTSKKIVKVLRKHHPDLFGGSDEE